MKGHRIGRKSSNLRTSNETKELLNAEQMPPREQDVSDGASFVEGIIITALTRLTTIKRYIGIVILLEHQEKSNELPKKFR